MFAIVHNNTVQQLVQPGTQFTVNDITYANNWLQLASNEDKTALGVVEVTYDSRPDDRYYWVTESAPIYDSEINSVRITYTTTDKDITQLKAEAVQKIKSSAHSLLSASDWMVTRAAEPNGTAVPTPWLTWRASIRTTAQTQITAVNSATTVLELIAITPVSWPTDPDYVAPNQS
jgi:hypothetical protein